MLFAPRLSEKEASWIKFVDAGKDALHAWLMGFYEKSDSPTLKVLVVFFNPLYKMISAFQRSEFGSLRCPA